MKDYQITATSKMNASTVDCPICMDAVEMTKNCVTTECGHCFHASCLMANVAHNGFGCPYCRTAMAEEPENEDDDTEGEYGWSDNEEEDEDELYDDYALRGLRFMTDNLEGVEHDILDVHDENEYVAEQSVEDETPNVPSVEYISSKLVEQGVTMEMLVKCILLNHDEYNNHPNSDEFDRIDNDIFGKIRILVSNYSPDQPATPVPRPETRISRTVDNPSGLITLICDNNRVEPISQSLMLPTVSEPKFVQVSENANIVCDAM